MFGLCAAIAVAMPGAATADVIELKTGQRVEGTLKQATPESVSIEIGGQVVTFEGERVRAIYFGTAPSGAAASTVSHRQAALESLSGLRAITKSGVTYRDYNTRLHDVTIAVDRYRRSAPESDERDALTVAIGFYSLAGTTWNARLSRGL